LIKLLKNLKPYWISVLGIVFFVFLQAITELYLPTLMADIVDIGIVNEDIDYIKRIGALMILIAFIAMTGSIIGSYLSAKVSVGFAKDLRLEVFTKVENFSLEEFNDKGTASLIVRTTNDITQIQRLTVMLLRMFLRAPLLFAGGIIMTITKNSQLALLLIAILPALTIIIIIVARKSTILFTSMQQKVDKLNLVFREYLTGIRVIRAFNRENYEKSRFDKSNYELTETTKKVNIIMSALMPLMMLILNLTIVTILWQGSIKIDTGSMQVGDLMAFIQYATQIMFSLIMVSMIFMMIPRASVSAGRINEVLDIEPEIKDPKLPDNKETIIKKDFDSRNISNFQDKKAKGYIEFRDVYFCYQYSEEFTIENISFVAKPGETTAIIGSTGSGKTTLINLIPRFFDVTKGNIMIDGTDIREMTQFELRDKIGLVPQNAVLFTGTVTENIRFGNDNLSQTEIIKAAETAQAAEFINSMPEGYQSIIAQGGTNLSGGQKQRLAIARALAKNPDIYIFDDSFSALDFKTEAKLKSKLFGETRNKTVLIIAQRVTTVMNADQIIVLDNGQISGIGKHQDLIKTCAVYKEIVSSQL
jgi:ATP-binding cassette subfamily B multidrug efflux pump